MHLGTPGLWSHALECQGASLGAVGVLNLTIPKDAPWHSWAVVACTGMSIGHKGMLHASKALGMTMVDIFEDPKLVKEIKAEFKERKGSRRYEPMIPPGPPPIKR